MTEWHQWTPATLLAYPQQMLDVCNSVGMKPVCENAAYCHNSRDLHGDDYKTLYIGRNGMTGLFTANYVTGLEQYSGINGFSDNTCYWAPYRNRPAGTGSPGYDNMSSTLCSAYGKDHFWKSQGPQGPAGRHYPWSNLHTFICGKVV